MFTEEMLVCAVYCKFCNGEDVRIFSYKSKLDVFKGKRAGSASGCFGFGLALLAVRGGCV